MFATAEAFQDIVVRLSVLRYVVTSNTKRGKHDIATDAEDFFAGFFNRLFPWTLVNLNKTERKNFPAIDLGDTKHRVAIQVTAENSVDKIKATLDVFYDHGLRGSYDRLIILILSRKLQYTTNFEVLKRDLRYLDIWDIDDVLALVETHLIQDELHDRDHNLIEVLEEFTRRELPSIVRTLASDPSGKYPGLLANLEVVIGHPPTSAHRFLDSLHLSGADERAAGLEAIIQLYVQLKDRSYIGSRMILAHAIQYSIDASEFKWRFSNYHGPYISEDTLIFAPHLVALHMTYQRREQFWKQVDGLQFLGWATQLEDTNFLSICSYSRGLELNLFYYLKKFLGNDIQKLRSVLVDLDFRHLD
ncbi:SMEK domain-containing protein [Noviherbaspirillum saxi]|uniref:SMEK domain-containing protein n=1 Tax=Noviherbaspirillum saxi TaxID=2320863 RepID=A0A3A3FL37_9BURK|nr:SMEK domain-containing protein [Noviherbaspirillum saxi]RJF92222.1 hypothetical protein D3871_26680 [Noviherbaspirillum saxi]